MRSHKLPLIYHSLTDTSITDISNFDSNAAFITIALL